MNASQDIHANTSVLRRGTPLEEASVAVIMLHGRGSSPQDILSLVDYLPREGVTYLAPTATYATWYPQRFVVPRAQNEPHLSSAMGAVARALASVSEAGIAPEKTVLLGFSQGACLALDYAAHHPKRYGGLVGLSGGLIGTDQEIGNYEGSLEGTPVFLGCSDVDFHIPLGRVQVTTTHLIAMGASVEERIYPNFGHSVNEDEIGAVNAMLMNLLA